jgi:GWxTD domain-containing protein
MVINRLIYIALVFLLIVSSCQRPPAALKPGREFNLADIYNPARISLRPDYSVHHVNDSISLLYVRVFPAELLFSQANESGELLARMRISFEMKRLDSLTGEETFVDSASITKVLNRNEARNSFFAGLPLVAFRGNKYALSLTIHDEFRNSKVINLIIVDKTSKFTAQNYKSVSARSGVPLFTNALSQDQQFRIQYNAGEYDSIYIDYYNPDNTLPRPVFSGVSETPLKTYPDSTWVYQLNDSIKYELGIPGTYVFRVDKSVKEGLPLMNFGANFPRVGSVDEMLGPLVYLTNSIEYRDLRNQTNRKIAIDNFWLGIAGSPDAARELIKVYYNRVHFANVYFTSYKEGWKTDRGMIYIIFGAPNKLEISSLMEKWTYFTGRSSMPIEFLFERKENLFTNMDYQASRNVDSSPYWRNAVQSWRKGKIYSSIN